MKIRINEFRLHPRDEFDGRRMSFLFQLLNREKTIGTSIINVTVTGSILPYWLDQLPKNPTETDLGKLVLQIIENDLQQILQNNYSIENIIDLKYWTGNSSQIKYDINDIVDVYGYEINIEE